MKLIEFTPPWHPTLNGGQGVVIGRSDSNDICARWEESSLATPIEVALAAASWKTGVPITIIEDDPRANCSLRAPRTFRLTAIRAANISGFMSTGYCLIDARRLCSLNPGRIPSRAQDAGQDWSHWAYSAFVCQQAIVITKRRGAHAPRHMNGNQWRP